MPLLAQRVDGVGPEGLGTLAADLPCDERELTRGTAPRGGWLVWKPRVSTVGNSSFACLEEGDKTCRDGIFNCGFAHANWVIFFPEQPQIGTTPGSFLFTWGW